LGAGVQAFATAVQGIESRSRDPLADALLVHALRVLGRYLPGLVANPDDAETRGQLMLGALLAGQGTDYAPSGLASAIAHCIGARFDLDNGIMNALILPHAMRFNAPATGNRLSLVTEALGVGVPDNADAAVASAIRATEQLFAQLGMPKRLRDVGVPEDALPQLAQDAAGDWFLHQNPRSVTDVTELLEIFKAAW
jgi:alcohol dehydrogenase class IV